MKQKIALILCTLFILLLISCGGGKYPLNGVWTGKIDDIDMIMAFIDDICIAMPSVTLSGRIAKYSYSYEKGKGAINVSNDYSINFTVKGNELTVAEENIAITVRKDTKTKTADKAIRGLWNGPESRLLAFVNNRIYYYDEDGYFDYGIFSFNKNGGNADFERLYENITFEVNGDTLTATIKIWDEENIIIFTKEK